MPNDYYFICMSQVTNSSDSFYFDQINDHFTKRLENTLVVKVYRSAIKQIGKFDTHIYLREKTKNGNCNAVYNSFIRT